MGTYVCLKCGKKFKPTDLSVQTLRCQYCGSKIMVKESLPTAKKYSTD
jgi:DNA-directed RNA polymerase subunit RPC12/RpoP